MTTMGIGMDDNGRVMMHDPFRGPQTVKRDFAEERETTAAIISRISPKQRLRIQHKAEKYFKRLMMEFIDLIQTKEIESPEVKALITDLDLRWRKYCYGVPEMTDEGKLELMKHINKIIDDMPIQVTLGKKDAPESATPMKVSE